MKKITSILFFSCIAIAGIAQPAKATREQTVAYIKQYFSEVISPCTEVSGNNKVFTERSISDVDVSFSNADCKLTISWAFLYDYNNFEDDLKRKSTLHHKYVIDLSKIESLALSKDTHGDCTLFYLNFQATAGATIEYYNYNNTGVFPQEPKKTSKAEIIISAYGCPDGGCNDGEINAKIIKAFNHLRKLCGAPEPVEF